MEKDVLMFEDPEDLKIGLERTRKNILDLLKVKGMTISQIAEALDKDQSTIYRHIKKLEDAGFIEVKDEKKKHHIPEKIYGRTAEVFILATEPMEDDKASALALKWKEDRMKICISILDEMGFVCDDKEEVVSDLADLFSRIDEEVSLNMDKSVAELEDASFFSILQAKFLADILKICNDESFKEELEELASRFEEVRTE